MLVRIIGVITLWPDCYSPILHLWLWSIRCVVSRPFSSWGHGRSLVTSTHVSLSNIYRLNIVVFHFYGCELPLRSWCLWELSVFALYDQIVIHPYITSDYDSYDVFWVDHLVLEDIGEVLLWIVMFRWVIFTGLIFKLCCYFSSGVMWMLTT